jgi:hypothetical protein
MEIIKLLLILAWCLISLPLILMKVPFIIMVHILNFLAIDKQKLKRMMEWKGKD